MTEWTHEERRQHADAFDPTCLSAAFHAHPYATYAALRELDPIHRCPDGSYFLTRHADLDRIYRDRSSFSSDKKLVFAPKFGADTPLYQHHTTSLVFNDAPYHTRVRRHVIGALTPRVLKAMEPDVVALVQQLMDRMAALREVDLIEHFAAAIPIEVIGNLLRVPHAERGPLRDWSLAILGALEPSLSPEQHLRGNTAVAQFSDYLAGLIADRRQHPAGDADLLTRLLREEHADEPLTQSELIHNCVFLLNAGHETTTNLIGNALQLLLTLPHELARLRANPAAIGTAVEECLRYESPNQLGNRLVIEPITLGGITLQPGTYLTLCIGAANRDPQEFPEPDRFDITRTPNRHLAFAAGAHACAGMSVARLEAQIALAAIVQRFPQLHLTAAPVRAGRARFRGLKSLPAAVG
jgi:hypothetical protein